ncbi:MAG: SpoIID/LytB domain-containing protein [Clostridiales bacterium]|nr:SpoIID/LytB domain-containing protein [Clostridiales bacterium]MCD8133081.1 SpoIID/LytB domain-containing protein [Clostridiales bacterium]
MKEKVKLYGSVLILILFIPWLLTVYLHGGLSGFSPASEADEQLEAQVVSVLASDIPADYELECLKAQAIIVRTNLCRTDGEDDGGWDEAAMQEAWGEDYEKNLERIRTAAAETEGEVLTCEGELIYAAYHMACNAKTRDAAEVPGQETYTYLQSVASADDILADGFLYVGYMEKSEFAGALAELFRDEEIDADQMPDALQITERDAAEYVTRVQVGSTVVNGEAVRAALGLSSACFYFSELEGKIRIVTKGVGHGLGFSQYGAQQLALKGYSCAELLQYYYTGVEIENR